MRTARQILAHARTVAVVGASHDPLSASYWVPKLLREHGWRIIPVGAPAGRILGERVYARLADVPGHVDVVNVYASPEETVEIVGEAVAIGADAVWRHIGVPSPRARRLAEAAGIEYVEDDYIGMEQALTHPGADGHGAAGEPDRRALPGGTRR